MSDPASQPASFHMTPAEFRRRGYEVVDWVARYLEGVEHRPVASTPAPGAVRARLPPHPPEAPEPFDAVIADLDRPTPPPRPTRRSRRACGWRGSRQISSSLVEVDERFALRPDALAAAMEDDLGRGLVPFLVVATVGTTSSMAIDPVPAIGALCQRHGVWLHVDAAMAGSAAVVPELRFVNAGLELADSWCFDPHKWLFTNFDCDVLYVADPSS